ncbi:sigma factor [Lentilactobacillus senioris]|uniref:sigma factor n=1 Tax=Lentilactobacillus senioris TaxID=931534 RepID=UPI002281937C|nr:sigma factor [Lentilactobacillus senioris]MCY9807145.1 sigma factor [Lentilactobacillus senioris]
MEQTNLDLINRAAAGDDLAILQLFNTYLPIVKKLQSEFYITNFEADDWYQEAQITLFRSTQKFDSTKNVTFGSFYKRNLHNRVIDLIRESQAKKRIPQSELHSIEAREQYYVETIQDHQDIMPDLKVLLVESIVEAFGQFSQLEKQTFIQMLEHPKTPHQFSAATRNAFDRCRKKFYDTVD